MTYLLMVLKHCKGRKIFKIKIIKVTVSNTQGSGIKTIYQNRFIISSATLSADGIYSCEKETCTVDQKKEKKKRKTPLFISIQIIVQK